jgi:hypothetical protein
MNTRFTPASGHKLQRDTSLYARIHRFNLNDARKSEHASEGSRFARVSSINARCSSRRATRFSSSSGFRCFARSNNLPAVPVLNPAISARLNRNEPFRSTRSRSQRVGEKELRRCLKSRANLPWGSCAYAASILRASAGVATSWPMARMIDAARSVICGLLNWPSRAY